MLALSSLKGDGERNVRFLRALPFAPAYLWQLGAYIRLLLADDDVGVAGFTSRPSFVSPLPLGQQRGERHDMECMVFNSMEVQGAIVWRCQ